MENKQLLEKIRDILIKRAEGYDYSEEIIEYVASDGQTQLSFLGDGQSSGTDPPKRKNSKFIPSKKKVSSHHVPPDLTAIKLLLDHFISSESEEDLISLSEDELKQLKEDLIKKLNQI